MALVTPGHSQVQPEGMEGMAQGRRLGVVTDSNGALAGQHAWGGT